MGLGGSRAQICTTGIGNDRANGYIKWKLKWKTKIKGLLIGLGVDVNKLCAGKTRDA